MQSPAIRAWWKFVRVFIAALVASLCAGFVGNSFNDEDILLRKKAKLRSEATERALAIRNTLAANATFNDAARTTLRVVLTREAMSTQCRVALPRGFLGKVQSTLAVVRDRKAVDGILLDYCGRAHFNWMHGEPESYRFYVAEGTPEGVMEVLYRPVPYSEARSRVRSKDDALPLRIQAPISNFISHGFTVELVTEGTRVFVRDRVPLSQTANQTLLRGTTRVMEELHVSVLPAEEPSVKPPTPQRPAVAEIVRSFRDEYTAVAEPLVDALMAALPFILILMLRRQSELTAVPGAERLFGFVYATTLLYAGIGLFRSVIDLLGLTTDAFHDQFLKPCEYILRTSGGNALSVAFVVFLWPALVRCCNTRVRLLGTSTKRSWLLLSGAVVMAIVAAFAAVEPCSAKEPDWLIMRAAAGVATLLALAALISEAADGFIRQLGFAAAMLFVATVFYVVDILTAEYPYWYLVAAPFGIPMVYTFGRLAFPHASRAGLLGVSALVALGLAYGRPDYTPSKPWLITAIGFDLSRVAMLVGVAGILWLLYHVSKTGKWHELEAGERAAGTVLFLLFLFVGWSVLYAATALVVGYAVMRYWTFVPRHIPDLGDPDAHSSIRDLIRLNEMESALRALKREMRAKLVKAEIRFHEYTGNIDLMETRVETQRKKLRAAPDHPAAAVLSSGTPVPPWQRGVDGARYGFLFGIPWIVLFLREFHSNIAPQFGADWVATLAAVIHVVGRWPVLGFFFGYFYPHLRGDTGISKGFYLFLGVTVPLFAATSIAYPANPDAWKSLASLALQLFIHCLLIGLIAGDYETLRASGLRWRHVIDVHNLGGVAAWGSSMIVAIATAIATLGPTAAGSLANVVASEVGKRFVQNEDAAKRQQQEAPKG